MTVYFDLFVLCKYLAEPKKSLDTDHRMGKSIDVDRSIWETEVNSLPFVYTDDQLATN